MEAKTPKCQLLNDKDTEELMKHYSGRQQGWYQAGEEKFFVPHAYERHGEGVFRMKLRPTDRWVVTFPRSGTLWMQELVWLICNDLNYAEAAKRRISERYYFIEFELNYRRVAEDPEENKTTLGTSMPTTDLPLIADTLDSMVSPRFFKTHVPFQLLPPDLLDAGCKIVYVARNPKDVVVSFYHMKTSRKGMKYTGNFESFWHFFQRDLKIWCPYWSHVKKAWSLRHHPNLLFVFYEEMKMDLPLVIRKASNFYGRPCTDEEVNKLVEHLDFESFRKNPMIGSRQVDGRDLVRKDVFVRKGLIGGWKELFTPELEAQADKWIEENLKDTDLRFPYIGSLYRTERYVYSVFRVVRLFARWQHLADEAIPTVGESLGGQSVNSRSGTGLRIQRVSSTPEKGKPLKFIRALWVTLRCYYMHSRDTRDTVAVGKFCLPILARTLIIVIKSFGVPRGRRRGNCGTIPATWFPEQRVGDHGPGSYRNSNCWKRKRKRKKKKKQEEEEEAMFLRASANYRFETSGEGRSNDYVVKKHEESENFFSRSRNRLKTTTGSLWNPFDSILRSCSIRTSRAHRTSRLFSKTRKINW